MADARPEMASHGRHWPALAGTGPQRPVMGLLDTDAGTSPSVTALNMSTARVQLPNGVGCNTLTDRALCCSAIDGRGQAWAKNQPCIAASTQFVNMKMVKILRGSLSTATNVNCSVIKSWRRSPPRVDSSAELST